MPDNITLKQYRNWTISLFDDSAFTNTPDSPTTYDNVYQSEEDEAYIPAAQHAIVVLENGIKVASAILLASAGATKVTADSALIDDGHLIVRCCNKIFCLTLPDLDLKWMTIGDDATCFSIHQYQDSYIIHGEMCVSRIDRNGKMLWEYGGRDIFVYLGGSPGFSLHDQHIEVMDFDGGFYKINYNGETLDYKP